MITILAFAFVLGVLIFVHELGHFLMARRIGVRVVKFSLGFGPRLFGFTRGDTEYCISAIPLGGYVKMAGENPDDPRTGRPDEFLSKTKWQRFQVLVMGPAMNLLLAVVVTAGVLMRGAEVPAFQSKPPIVGQVAEGSAAAKGGIRTGDRIVSVAGRDVNTWEQFLVAVGTRANRETPITLMRDGKEVTVDVTPTPQTKYEVGDVGVLPDVHPHVVSVLPGSPAERAALKANDVILAVDRAPVTFPKELIDAISKKANVTVTLTIARNGTTEDVRITPELSGRNGRIGINIAEDLTMIKPGPIDAIGMSIQRNYESAKLIFQTVGQLITRETSTRQLMGPLAIAQLSGESAQAGWIPLLSLMASISLNLGLLNLLPIPVLDGGHIFIMALEGLARRDFSTRVKEKMFLAGFAVLLMLMVTVIYNDLTRIPLFEKLMPWR
ncbi:MAG TPA: RIP metalloprotease RseP [Vicinamibacterales bacterium]|nr:RIP metalloprotease RseP [Vicinamibacterales bacterium]